MWKSITLISLAVCVTASADETPAELPISVKCCGRLRDGVAAIGGETTGTTITFNGIIWELELADDAARAFAKENHKQSVFVTGHLRKKAGVEKKERWIVDVKTIRKCDAAKPVEGAGLKLCGVLRREESFFNDVPRMSIIAGGHLWPIDFTTVPEVGTKANALVGERISLTGLVDQVVTKEPNSKVKIISVRTLDRCTR